MDLPSRWALLGATALLACGQPSANESPTGMGEVPEELAMVLLGMQERDDRIFVGDPPDETLAAVSVLPPGSPVGGLIREGGGTIVIQVDDALEAVRSAYQTAMEQAGWERAATGSGIRGGFVSSQQYTTGTWCSASHSLRTSALTRQDINYVRIRYSTLEPGPTPCENASLRARIGPGRYGLTLPSLQPPAEAEVSPRGGGGSSDSVEMEVFVETSLEASELFEHYARQLGQSDWTPTGEASDRQISIGRWSTQDEMGSPAVGVFAVWSLPGDNVYRAWIRLERAAAGR